MLNHIRQLSGGGLLQVPSSYRDHLNPDIASDLERFVRSPGLKSAERTRLCALAWAQTASVRTYRAFDWSCARAMIERCLAGYELPAAPPRRVIGSSVERGRTAA